MVIRLKWRGAAIGDSFAWAVIFAGMTRARRNFADRIPPGRQLAPRIRRNGGLLEWLAEMKTDGRTLMSIFTRLARIARVTAALFAITAAGERN